MPTARGSPRARYDGSLIANCRNLNVAFVIYLSQGKYAETLVMSSDVSAYDGCAVDNGGEQTKAGDCTPRKSCDGNLRSFNTL
jgi:hypothetical protein